MRLTRLRVFAGLAAIALLAGCGGQPATETTPETTPAAPAERVSVTVGMIPGFPSISMAHLLEANENGETGRC